MSLNEYLSDRMDLPLLKRFAYLGSTSDFEKKLNYLIMIAEPELWNQTDIHTQRRNSTIFYYIIHTFDRCFNQSKLYIDNQRENAFFNTGLMTVQGNEIYGHFVKSIFFDDQAPKSTYWYFKGFEKSNEKEFLSKCPTAPEIASYFEDFNELYFNPKLEIEVNFDHIYDDNFDRLPTELQSLDKETGRHVFKGFLDFTIKKIKRNNRTPVPQFYDGRIMFLIPVKVFGKKNVIIALEKINNTYIANTVLSIGMAYNCARLLNKPESDWLLSESNNMN